MEMNHEEFEKFLTSTFPKYTREMYEGNAPACEDGKMVSGGVSEKWHTRYGTATTYNGKIITCEFSLSPIVHIDIVGEHLSILNFRGVEVWEYVNDGIRLPFGKCLSKQFRHELEPEKIERYLNTVIKNCKLWNMVQSRARQLYKK